MGTLFSFSLQAQKLQPCGTPGEISPALIEYRAQKSDIQFRNQSDTVFIRMKIHLVGTDQGEGFYGLDQLLESVCKLNEDMIQSGILMEMDDDINYIANDRYNDHGFTIGRQMMALNNLNGFVNCYIVSNPAGNCGYFSSQGNAVALSKGCLGADNTTWAHELGHFFSLPHTFVGWEGTDYEYGEVAPIRIGGRDVEKADGSNCETAADGFCDTEADYLSFRWTCRGFNSPDSLMDPDSVSFIVDGRNIMSYSNDRCARFFSDEQTDAMIWNINNQRSGLISDSPIPATINFDENDFEPTAGFDGEIVQFDNATLSWKPVENATHYLIEITKRLPFATPPDYRFFLTDTFINIDFFEKGSFYEWRVKPFNALFTCEDFSDEYLVEAQDPVSSIQPIASNLFSVYPNPIMKGEKVNLTFRSEYASVGQITVTNLSGQLMYTQTTQTINGFNDWTLTLDHLSSGVYILNYRDESGSISKKLLLQ